MVEEVQAKEISEKLSEAECKALYDLIVKKNLTDDEKNQIKTTIETSPQILAQKEFTQNFKMTDFALECAKPEDLPIFIEQNKQNIENLNQALSNLKEAHVTHNGKNKTAAQFLLDTPILESGELIGTQLAKNIHFLGTASRDSHVPAELKDSIQEASGQSAEFYKSLYASDGYGANRNARNFSGQKVEKLMLECLAAREGLPKATNFAKELAEADGRPFPQSIGYVNINPDTIESVKTRAYMEHPDMSKERETLTVEKPRETMSFEALAEKAYRGTLTVEEKELFNKMKQSQEKREGNMSNDPRLDPHRPEKKKHDDKFKECDVIDYMYNEWFLAGLSWLFDKAEDGLDFVLDKLIDTQNQRSARRAKETAAAKNAASQDVIKKIHSFQNGVDQRIENAAGQRAARIESFKNEGIAPLLSVNFESLPQDSAKKAELEAKYGASLIGKFIQKAAEPNGQKELKACLTKCPQRFENMFKISWRIEDLAMQQVKLEMTNDVMRSTGTWQQKGKSDLKTDDELLSTFDARVAERKAELSAAVSTLTADAKLKTEAAWTQIDPKDTDKQKEFIDENILKALDERIASAEDASSKEALRRQKQRFKENYDKLSSSESRTELISQTVATLKVGDFLREQAHLTEQAKHIQNSDLAQGHYDVNGYYPDKNAAKNLEKASNRRDSVAKNGINDTILKAEVKEDTALQKNLYEATFQTSNEKILEAAQNIDDNTALKLEARRTDLNERKQRLSDFLQSLKIKEAVSRISPLIMGQQGKFNG